MVFTQVKGAIAEVANQLIGAQYLPVATITTSDGEVVPNDTKLTAKNLDDYNPNVLADIGVAIKNYAPAFDIVFNTLVEQLGKMVIDDRKFVADLPDIFVDPIEWGGYVEWVRVGLSDVMDDPMWNPEIWQYNYNDTVTGPVGTTYAGEKIGKAHARKMAEIAHGTYLPKVRAKAYQEAKSIMVALSTLRQQMFTAFKGWDEQNRFLSALYNSVENTLRLKAKCFAMATVAAGIATSFGLKHAFNILEEAHARGIETSVTTAKAALNNDKIKAFALEFMQNTKDNMREMSAAYNDGVDLTFTPADDNRLLLLAPWANNLKYSIRANTFNEQLLGIGDYKKVACWQAIDCSDGNGGSVGGFNWEAVSSVYFNAQAVTDFGLTANADNTEVDPDKPAVYSTFKQDNIIGFMYDKYGLGMTLQKETTTTQYSAPEDKVNTFWHGLFNYIVNGAYNMVTFYLADHTLS